MENHRQSDGLEQGAEPSGAQGGGAANVWPAANDAHERAVPANVKHSGVGIASFVVALIGIALLIVAWLMVSMAVIELDQSGALTNQEDFEKFTEDLMSVPELIGGTLLMMLSGFLLLIGTILGIVSLFQQQRKKLFPILGTVLNVLPLLLLVFIMSFGLIAGI